GWENTLNRVPELPKAQEGTSMVCLARASRTCAPAVEVMSAATPNIGRRIPRIDSETIHLVRDYGGSACSSRWRATGTPPQHSAVLTRRTELFIKRVFHARKCTAGIQ